MIFRTALCDALGIEYPILQSGMGGIAGPELVAEVCRAGALGILAVFSAALGTPDVALARRFFERGIKIVAMVATVKDARAAASAGVDVIVAQGFEAGGHRSTGAKGASADSAAVGTLALVPQVVDA